MKFLHTADWHLGDRLGRIDRTEELRRAVERIADVCRQEAVDVVIVAGDLFSELPRADGLRECVRHLQDTFAPFFRRGGTMLAVTGNHDHEGFCRTLRHAMGLAAPGVEELGAVVSPGRLYLADSPTLLRLADPKHGGHVQFVLMPYPTPAAYLTNEVQQRYDNLEQKTRFLQAAFAGRLNDLRKDCRYDRAAPTVLVAHVHVQGADAEHLYRSQLGEEIICPQGTTEFTYWALGHIHKPHHLTGRPHVRYSGSLARLDLGEANDAKGVVLFEIHGPGKIIEPVVVPLDAAPIYEVRIHDPGAELPRLRDRFPDRDRALVKLDIRYTAGADSLEAILRELDAIFPRWYARSWVEADALDPTLVSEVAESGGFEEVIRQYLDAELQAHPEPTRTAIGARIERLLHDLPHGGAS